MGIQGRSRENRNMTATHVDMEATMQRLVRVRDFVAEVASLRYRF